MCTELQVGDRDVTLLGELRALIAPVPVRLAQGYRSYETRYAPQDDDCLCCVDMRATARAAGFRCETTAFGYRWTPKVAA